MDRGEGVVPRLTRDHALALRHPDVQHNRETLGQALARDIHAGLAAQNAGEVAAQVRGLERDEGSRGRLGGIHAASIGRRGRALLIRIKLKQPWRLEFDADQDAFLPEAKNPSGTSTGDMIMTTRSLALKHLAALAAASALSWSLPAAAHCDTLDGPVVAAARKALDTGNVNLVLVWVREKDDAEIRRHFDRTRAVRKLNAPAKELADMYFFETLV